ncbi:MAG: NAD(P)H-dependent oxidoreductase [Acidobacteriota bacterium]|nr:NAD(P)H-dependent oxidoreductase [Acidobacteriota bacterium]
MNRGETLHILAASGSSRPGNYTRRVLALAVDELQIRHQVQVDLIDLSTSDFPFPGQGPSQATHRAQDLVKGAAGILLATPEYHGSYSSAMKRFIENLGFPSTLAGKPVALLGAAAGQIGAVKALEHLGSVCSHVGAFVLPGPVSVARVQKVFDGEGRCLDAAIEKRIRGLATHLMDYIDNRSCPRATLEQSVRGARTERTLQSSS